MEIIPNKRDNALSIRRKNWKTTLHFGLNAGEWFCVPSWCFALISPVIRLYFVSLMLKRMCLRFSCAACDQKMFSVWSQRRWKINLTIFSQDFSCGFRGQGGYIFTKCTGIKFIFPESSFSFGFAEIFSQDIKEMWLDSIKNAFQNKCRK